MSAESSLYAILTAHAPLTALVGAGADARIYPDALPEECDYPALVTTRSATEPIATLHGTVAGAFVTLAISCWGGSRDQSDAVAAAVESALAAAGEIPLARAGGYAPEMDLYATTLEVTLLV